ncbi:MAG: N-6 DNA methylase [Desulfomonile sp.]|nr:N-6 DNA methylase [Desulfomonile sp.]
MERQQNKQSIRSEARAALLDLIDVRLHEDPRLIAESTRLMQQSLADLVDALLSPDGNGRISAAMQTLHPEDVGDLYEYLRGFKLVFGPNREPRLERSAYGKRNEGLFYTPAAIVGHIVTRTLEEIAVEDEIDFLSVKVLDPALGTGAFLAEALEQLTTRVFSGGGKATRSTVRQITESFAHRMKDSGVRVPLDERIAVRVAILENCLYGVDLDPVAVTTAKALLIKSAFGTVPVPHHLKINLRVGNALIGTAKASPHALCRNAENCKHAGLYLNARQVDSKTAAAWASERLPIHWWLEFPEVFSRKGGFDVVVGNPPYEVLSVKESGIDERHREQSYFRKVFRSCHGKINTYRLMMERSLEVLRDGGVMGFIVPATLLADSTAEKLRRMLLDETRIAATVLIPERARVFDRVTQALAILVAKKGERTEVVSSAWWDGSGPIPDRGKVAIERRDLEWTGFRVPILRTTSEKKLLDLINRHPPLRGGGSVAPAGIVHQGEVNLTVHRKFITSEPTGHPLVRGEHVHPFRLVHPAPRGGRLDWVVDGLFGQIDQLAGRESRQNSLFAEKRAGERGRPWEERRIVLGRVVNMATNRRLKAAEVLPRTFLGDMTNFVTDLTVPLSCLVGLLNSALLNWRIKITNTNNYLSAAEIEALPIPRCVPAACTPEVDQVAEKSLDEIYSRRSNTIIENLRLVRAELRDYGTGFRSELIALMVEKLTMRILDDCCSFGLGPAESQQKLLDSLVLELYGAGDYAEMIEEK